jgi:putative sigma-54 modulation protein
MPRKARLSAHAEVRLKATKKDGKTQHLCEVVMHLPHDTLNTKEATVNIYAAVDIVEAKLQSQLKKYKSKHNPVRLHKRFVARLRRSKSTN